METIALRCTNCGAPLPKPKQGEEWVKCEYCGFHNKIVDASRYVENLKKELEKWIREILPPTMVTSTVADLAARHQIFKNLIKPKLTMIKANVRAKYLQYLSNPLIPLPPPQEPSEEPRNYFEEALKIQAVREFAVSDEDTRLVEETILFSSTTGLLINAFKALSKHDVKSALKNIDEAISNMPSDPSYSLVKQRLSAAKTVLSALDQIYVRNTSSALDLAKISIDQYKSLLDKIGSNIVPEVNKGILEIEKTIAEAVYNVAEASHRFFTAGRDPLEVMKWIEYYMKVFTWLRNTYGRPVQDIVEITLNLRKFTYGITGSSEVIVTQGKGSIYVPFHIVDCRLTYAKGFIMKKGLESKITLLVSSIVPYVDNPITDVFGLSYGKTIQLTDVEKSTIFNSIREIVSSSRPSSLQAGARGFPPFISSILAEKIADDYIGRVNARYGGKIAFASTSATGLVYVPFETMDQRTLVNDRGLTIRLTTELNNLTNLTL